MKNGAKKRPGRAKTSGKRRRIAQKIGGLKILLCFASSGVEIRGFSRAVSNLKCNTAG
jgi:hypothetical protein